MSGVIAKRCLVGAVALLCLVSCIGLVLAREPIARPLPRGVYLDIDKEFYEALKAEGGVQSKTYSNDMNQEYLRQIAVSTRFMVETNFRIIRNQERIIQLLETLLSTQQNDKN
ncbi:MAG: hypothetical protein DRH12_15015 [Deltaproteobacteria bacterium]|nr:MAG: hypothetical protein DRH12_15015 [Deltaproteobacteria bacterium]